MSQASRLGPARSRYTAFLMAAVLALTVPAPLAAADTPDHHHAPAWNVSTMFDANKATLSSEDQEKLADLAVKLVRYNKEVHLEIRGYTDSTEAAAYHLGEDRAQAVRRFLYAHGIPLNRMNTMSYGSAEPAQSNDTEAGRAANRRVVVVVMA